MIDSDTKRGVDEMIDCISVENMRQSDAYTINNLVPSLELMYRAACGVYENVQWSGNIAILAGSGNNGGDGYALACILKDKGISSTVYSLGNRLSDDSRYYAEKARALGVEITPFSSEVKLDHYSILVDCLLGTGFRGAVREDYRLAIERINASGAYVVSVDINSGMNGDTGAAETAVQSDLTVTIGYIKNGLVAPNAGQYMKRLICVDIGIVLIKKENLICGAEEWKNLCLAEGVAANEPNVQRDSCIYYQAPPWLIL